MKSNSEKLVVPPLDSLHQPQKYYGISRIDQEKTKNHGWYLRIVNKHAKVTEFFSDKLHGGKVKAFLKASIRRNEVLSKLPEHVLLRAAKPRPKRKKS